MRRVAFAASGRQRGQAIAEYVYVVPVMLLLVLGAIQFAFIYQAKSTLNYATFVATRQGALKNGAMGEIKEALAGGLAPLFTHDKTLAGLKTSYAYAEGELHAFAGIYIVNPTQSAFDAHVSRSGDEMPNDNLMYRDSTSKGGMSIQDANLLKVRVVYCFRMVVPIINKLIFTLAVDTPGGSTASCVAGVPDGEYRIPINAEAVVRMQTPFLKANRSSLPPGGV